MSRDTHNHERAIEVRTFGRRKARSFGPRQQRLLDDVLPRLRIQLSEATSGTDDNLASGYGGEAAVGHDSTSADMLDLTALFSSSRGSPASDGDTVSATSMPAALPAHWLEIGFGGGEHLVWQAAANPGVNLIGCEPFLDGVVKVLSAVELRGLNNIRIHDDDARDLIRRLPPRSIDRGFILFPDPWPKSRHRKRRLVSPATLDLLARVMKPGAELRIGTDIADYARVILLAIQEHPAFNWPANGPRDWQNRPADWPETRYEQKAKREGRRCCYFQFQRL